jgi:hypothetical protein
MDFAGVCRISCGAKAASPARIRDVISEYSPINGRSLYEQPIAAAMLRATIEVPAPAHLVIGRADIRKARRNRTGLTGFCATGGRCFT